MIFSSSIFIFCFLPLVLLIYFISKEKYRNVILLFASLFFYAWGEPINVLIMLSSIIVNYLLSIWIEKSATKKKIPLVFSILYNFGLLFYFKYFNFVVGVLQDITGIVLTIKTIALPIGISFFTFQIMSYVVDVYREQVPAQKNIVNLGLYISLFPQLIAGPIVRYIDIEKQIKTRQCSVDKAYEGFGRFAIGFAKKILIADQLSPLVDLVFRGEYPSIWGKWIGIIAYTLQIYYDFSGYSDMAIGLGKIFGFDFLENFNYPYISKSIKEFWRRWHMSLSTWFRDYLYIPLGGNRKGTFRTYLNLFIVFFATGLWHGASYNFIVWGLYYGVFLVLERIGLDKLLKRLPVFFQHCYAIIIILIGWVFFRAESLSAAISFLGGMIIPHGNDLVNYNCIMDIQYYFCLSIGIICAIPHDRLITTVNKTKIGRVFREGLTIIVFLLAICYLVGSGYSPFLYFRF